MSALGDPADVSGVDQFQSHRVGSGEVLFEGRWWTRLEWIERAARKKGSTLAPGEGEVLMAEIDRLRAKVRELQGWYEEHSEKVPGCDCDFCEGWTLG